MILAIMESKIGGYNVAYRTTPCRCARRGPSGVLNRSMRPGAGAKPLSGSSAFRRLRSVTCRRGGSPSRRPPRATVNLKLDQVQSSGALGHRMFDLETGVHFREQESVALRFVTNSTVPAFG